MPETLTGTPNGSIDCADIVVIGSGFGGAVVARRLAQANRALDRKLEIVLLERGRRYEPGDFPRLQLPDDITDNPALRSSRRLPDASRLSWAYDQGLWQIRDLGGLRVGLAAGYGGGSLIYAGVHLRPPDSVFDDWPQAYRRNRLNRYFTLVEAMLDVRPAPREWIKTDRMEAAARELGREESFFFPPIAVTFDAQQSPSPSETRDNGFGVQQRGCIGCGECIIGCPHQSKNTLDLNYLAGIEENGVRVRPLSEAVAIGRPIGDPVKHRFRVRCHDYLKGGLEYVIDADFVFVCAGAIGSTELLLRSRESLTPDWRSTGLAHAGERFFANGDAPGVIFGTTQPWEPSKGPTITTSFYHSEDRQWFLLQEGAIPASLHRGLGFLQSPLWFGLNAFGRLDRDGEKMAVRATNLHEVVEKLYAVPRMSRAFAAIATGRPMDSGELISSVLPRSLRKVLDPIEPPGDRFRRSVADLNFSVVDRLAQRYQERCPIPLVSQAIGWAIRWFGKRPATTLATLEELTSRIRALGAVQRSTSAPALGLQMLLEVLLGPPPSDSTAILLAMGPDSRWTLRWDGHRRELSATGDTPANVSLYGLQERLMRDVASVLGGELRTNPGWTIGRRPLTVHSQGGCSMSEGPDGVTEPDSLMVRGIDGLYVFDGAVFPGSVGVNPSSTIAAVAECNIERFVQARLSSYASSLAGWTAEAEEGQRLGQRRFTQLLVDKQRQWCEGPGRILDNGQHLTAPTVAVGPGLEWSEVMTGFFGDCVAAAPTQFPIAHLDATRFRSLERDGHRRLQHVRAALVARLDNLEGALLPDSTRSVFTVSGELQLSWHNPQRYRITQGTLTLDIGESLGSMTYWIEALSDGKPPTRLKLVGVKQLREDPGVDTYKDLTTLFTLMTHSLGTHTKHYGGVLYVPLLDFVGTQLPSMDVVGQDISAERKSLLLLSFVRHFFRGLSRIYTIGEL
jgi:choline dehydrogenase-like flavoprotein